jgi:hypothetical protein
MIEVLIIVCPEICCDPYEDTDILDKRIIPETKWVPAKLMAADFEQRTAVVEVMKKKQEYLMDDPRIRGI